MRRVHALLLVGLAAGAASCASTDLTGKNRKLLEQAVTALEQGELAKTVALRDDLLASTEADAGAYRLQRFGAAYLAAEAHLRASFAGAWLREPETGTRLRLGAGGGDDTSPTAHMVAAARQISYGMDLAPSGVSEKALAEQLPASLAELGVENAKLGLSMGLLTVYSRLGFESKVSRILEQNAGMLDLASCQRLMDAARLPDELRPRVTYLVFRHQRELDERMAYRFAVRTLFPAAGGTAGVERAEREALQQWIVGESSYVFTCPLDGVKADPTTPICSTDLKTHLLDFVASKRE